MDIILLEDVKTMGKKGDLVKVNDGYARNYIIPKKLGMEATNKNLNDYKLKKANEAKLASELLASCQKLSEEMKEKKVVLKMKVGEGGRTFGSISSKEVATAMKEQLGYDVDKKKLQLKDPIKTLGMHIVAVKLHPKVTSEIKVQVVEN